MIVTSVEAEAVRVVASGLDPIHVFWVNVEPGQGYATVICYGCAWSVYFGAMSGRTIQRFFAEVGTDYLVNAMNRATTLKQGKKYDAHLGRIVKAIQVSLAETVEHEAQKGAAK